MTSAERDAPSSHGARSADEGLAGVTAATGVAEALVEAAVVVRADGIIAFANAAAGPLLGWSGSVVGRPLAALVAPRSRRGLLGELRRLGQGRSGRPRRVWIQREDGSEVPLHLGFTTCGEGEARAALVVGWDASGEADPDQYRRIADELLGVLAGASGTTSQTTWTLLATLARGLGFDVGILWRRRRGREELWCEQIWYRQELSVEAFVDATRGATLRPGDVVPGAVMATGEPLWVPDVAAQPDFRRGPVAARVGLRSGFAFPIHSRDRVVGVVELYACRTRDPDEPLHRAVARVGSRLGDFIERLELEAAQSELVVELQAARRRQTFLLEVNRALVGARTLEETIQRLAKLAVPTVGDICLVDVVGSDGALVRLAAQHADPAHQPAVDELLGYPPDASGNHPAAVAARTGESHVAPEMREDFLAATTKSPRHLALVRELAFTSYATAPVLVDDRALGAITVVSAGSGRRFGSDDLGLIEELAGQVAAVVDHARSSAEERRISHSLQQSLLPARLECPPGLEVAARYLTGSEGVEVGGDFYDAICLPDGRLVVAIGDVEGHDMTATTLMGQVRSALRAYLEVEPHPEEVLHLLDRYVERHGSGRLTTVSLAVIDAASGAVTLASAGHPAPLLIGPGPRADLATVVPGPPLGTGSPRPPTVSLTLAEGATLAFYTDGLIERRVGGPEARLATLIGTASQRWTAGAAEVCDALLTAASGGARLEDDAAVLVVARPAGAPTAPEGYGTAPPGTSTAHE